jgi:hypothetical protein
MSMGLTLFFVSILLKYLKIVEKLDISFHTQKIEKKYLDQINMTQVK